MSNRNKPTPGHKFGGISFRFVARCECGWQGSTFCGKGGQAAATEEWRSHIWNVHREEAA